MLPAWFSINFTARLIVVLGRMHLRCTWESPLVWPTGALPEMNSPSSWRTTHWSTLWSCRITTTRSSTPTCSVVSSEEPWRWWAHHHHSSIPCCVAFKFKGAVLILWNVCYSGSDGRGCQICSGHPERGQRDRNPYEVHQEDRRKPPSWRWVTGQLGWSGLQRIRSHNKHCHTRTKKWANWWGIREGC